LDTHLHRGGVDYNGGGLGTNPALAVEQSKRYDGKIEQNDAETGCAEALEQRKGTGSSGQIPP
jgi:hypothetical protein